MSKTMKIYPVILSGGSGTRLWPMSRAHYPKQLLPMVGDKTMIQETAGRFSDEKRFHPVMVISNDQHRFMVAEQLQAMDQPWSDLILEPVGRNTAPAAAIAALRLLEDDENAVMCLLPSDHVITDLPSFNTALEKAGAAADDGRLVTFGMTPTRPETGYGYIRQGSALGDGIFQVASFLEKPNRETAEDLIAAGDVTWNSGMFLLPCRIFVDELAKYHPNMVDACRNALKKAQRDLDFLRLDKESFEACPSDSIDYAVMEKTDLAAVVPAEIGWNDVGAWQALRDVSPLDGKGNAVVGDVMLHDVSNSYIRSDDGSLIAAIGLDDVTIVTTQDAVLVSSNEKAQDVKAIVDRLKKDNRSEAVHHKTVYRPWGSYRDMDEEERFRVKRIIVKPGEVLSLQRHQHRSEHWIIVRGIAKVTSGDKTFLLNENESTYIPKQTIHRLENPGKIPLHMIEVQVGEYVGEDDIERLEDTYGRVE
ncbi:mannose-1-phosphate guanylyltransferase/mannose-6-phosphate isomerase [Aestuariispira insulae]|uniref:mannose-1-phosphate guanylyltransferase n=1 Tax=Aestuariispira insulae TaxID=1461337 RepID=A0A3D9HS28_9PROT|nr:mannose-1-phosphate guanylyltransferase/mannose-6-phosphate isomerase [Aestuariispira insulae]RED52302.1 mannose-1-phosphate guanylyltransferase/mannose-1-phosphate guanylyltransferase/mannose-6-phosphate isomerase [Aestuariispira insulae]